MEGASGIRAAWHAAVDVTASAYGLDVRHLLAESRGRGPRPPEEIWQAKKMAVHLAILLSGRSYSALAREIGFHRDTVCSHCAWMREARISDHRIEELANSLETSARLRLASGALTAREVALSDPLDKLLGALREYAGQLAGGNGLHPTKDPFIRQNAGSRKVDPKGRAA